MSPENDQTRWIGIRPVNPSEDIPVTTQKLPPAISDLQAIKHGYSNRLVWNNQDCSVELAAAMAVVPAGEIYVITNALVRNITSWCDMSISALVDGTVKDLKCFYSIPKNIGMSWDGFLVLMAGEKMYAHYLLGGAADTIHYYTHGYKIGVY